MKLKLSELPNGSCILLSKQYDAEKLGAELNDLHYIEPILLKAEAYRDQDTLHLSGTLTGRAEQQCARCLSPVIYSVAQPIDLFYDTENCTEVDATDDVRQLLVLDYNPKILCRTECRGLCAKCGGDLNLEVCRCNNATSERISSDISKFPVTET